MNRLFWVRHGESSANIEKIFSSRKFDCPLTSKGVLQAQQTADYFVGKEIHEVYSSPLMRAVETAEIIANRLELDFEIIENFREVNVGDLDGQPMDELNLTIHQRILNAWFSGKPEIQFPNGENHQMLWGRMQEGLKSIVAGKSGMNLLVVGHGGIFKYTLNELSHSSDSSEFEALDVPNCSISQINFDLLDGQLSANLVSLTSTDHLFGSAALFIDGLPEQ